ncbi:MAG: hypothetical protein LBL58_04460 [Tannerellaceae bacterium]|jgi:hypothetical protein|nr:hypothetical protein [Tannerellaceae bacterium]
MKSKVKDLLTGKVLTMAQLSKLVSVSEYNAILRGELIHKYEHTRKGMKEIKLGAIL